MFGVQIFLSVDGKALFILRNPDGETWLLTDADAHVLVEEIQHAQKQLVEMRGKAQVS